MPGLDKTFDLIDNLASGGGAGIAAAIGDDAEGAAVITAGLHLNIGAGAAVQPVHEMTGDLADRHDVIHLHLVPATNDGGLEGFRPQLLGIAKHLIHLGHLRELLGIDLGGAAGDDHAGIGALALHPADGLARLTHGFVGDRAGVDDHRIG